MIINWRDRAAALVRRPRAVRLCLVSLEYPPETGWGGIGTQTYHKAHSLSRRGYEVHVLSGTWGRSATTSRNGDAIVHRIPIPPHGPLGGDDSPARWLAYSISVAEKLHALGQQVTFDIIHFPDYGGEGFIYQTGTFRRRTARYVLQLHGPLAMFAEHLGWPEPDHPLNKIGCFMERMVIHHADLVLASSHNTAAFSAKRYEYPLHKIEVIHSGVDTSRFRPGHPSPDERFPKILFVGKLIKGKGIVPLVNAVLQLRRRYPDVRLRCVGKADPELLAQLERTIAAAAAGDVFEMKGNVAHENLPEHYAWCDLFAGPSIYEPGPGIVYLEAMSCAKPVIACDSGGTPESVIDKQVGLLVAPDNAEALEDAIATLAEDKSLRERLGQNGRAWVQERFSIDAYSNRVAGLYRQVIS